MKRRAGGHGRGAYRVWSAVFCALFFLFPPFGEDVFSARAAERPVADILIINSFHPGHFWEDSLQKGIFMNMHGQKEFQIRTWSEYLDYERNSSGSFNDELVGLFQKKYRNVPLSVVIAIDDDALDFVLTNRKSLFHRVPVVFCGVADLEGRIHEEREYYTGIVENFSIRRLLEAVAAVHPRARHLAVICGDTTSSKTALAQAGAELSAFARERGVDIVMLGDLPPRAMEQALKALPEDAVLLNLGYYRSSDGQNFSMDESLQLLRSWTELPMYSPWESQIGRGVLAGQGEFNAFHADQASRMTLEILRGVAPEDIPVMREPAAALLYDYPMLRHYGLDEDELPAFAGVVNRPPSFFSRHRAVLIPAFAVLVLLCGIIVLLVRLLRIRQKAEALLRQEKEMMAEQYAFERRSQLARRMEAVGRMAGGVTHDVNNILGSIFACAQLALEDIPASNPAHEDVRRILEATARGRDIMAQIRMTDGSHARAGRAEEVSVKALLLEWENLMRPGLEDGVRLEVEDATNGAAVHGVPTELYQILFNLGVNAVQSMPEGGRLSVRALPYEKKRGDTELEELAEGSYVRFDVRDTGRGIAPEIREFIFDPFFTTKENCGGCGLGLAQVHSLAQRNHGAVRLADNTSGGTCFSVYVPRSSRGGKSGVSGSASAAGGTDGIRGAVAPEERECSWPEYSS